MIAQRDYYSSIPVGIESPAVHDALTRIVPGIILAEWRELASDRVDTGDYIRRLNLDEALVYPFEGNPDAIALINYSEHAGWLEDGRAGFSMALAWGARGGHWKVNKDGGLYAHVPFGHGSPLGAGGGASTSRTRNAMPPQVYRRAVSQLQGPKDRLTGFGDDYKKTRNYVDMKAAGIDVPQFLVDRETYTWKASQYEGMFAGIQSTDARPRHAEYTTIRTITPDSDWFIPPTEGHRFAARAIDAAMPAITDVMRAAEAQDLAYAIDSALAGIGDVL